MQLSNAAKEVAVNHFLSDYHCDKAHEAFDSIMEDPEVLDECVVWEVFDNYPVEVVANWLENLLKQCKRLWTRPLKQLN